MKEVQRKNILLTICFWAVGLSWILIRNLDFFWTHIPRAMFAGLLLVIAVMCLIVAGYLIVFTLQGYKDYRVNSKDEKMFNFWFTEVKTTSEYEDERSLQISNLASRKSNGYTQAFVAILILIMIFSGTSSIPAELLIFFGLMAFTIGQVSYILVWKKEYYN